MAVSAKERLAAFNPATSGRYDPGSVVVFFDNRSFKHAEDKSSMFQNYWLDTKSRLGWTSLMGIKDLEPGKLRLVFYTHAGVEGQKEFPLHMAYAVKEMYDTLAEDGFRPAILGWSKENPYPMIGGTEPPPKPKIPKEKPRATKTESNMVSGHSSSHGNPHDRVMKIIEDEEEREAKERAREVRASEDAKETDALV